MSDEPKYELRITDFDTGETDVAATCETWDEAANEAARRNWGRWETPAEFVLQDGVTIKAVWP